MKNIMGKCVFCNKNIGFLDMDTRCNHGKGWLQDHSQDHIAHQKCCMRANIIVQTPEQQNQCKHEYKSLADKNTLSWTLLKETQRCIKCGHETIEKSLI